MPRCRFDREKRTKIYNLFVNNRECFRIAHKEGKYIFSHSGIHPLRIKQELGYFGEENLSLSKVIDKLNTDWLNNESTLPRVLNNVSWLRGGYSQIGSCVWGDICEFINLGENLDWDMYQIFGHTRTDQEVITPDWAMLDAQKAFRLHENFCTIEEIRLYDIKEFSRN